MAEQGHSSQGKGTFLNVAIIFVLAVLAMLLFQLFRGPQPRQCPLSRQVIQQEVFAPKGAAQEEAVLVEQAAVVPAAVVAQGKFFIQAASFQDKAKADSVAEKLKAKGHEAVVESKDLGEKGIWYRVHAGSFETKEQAQEVLNSIKQEHPGSFIKER
ncbi:MAG TPA: SPOR domain-containing protein [Candidatus Omnitrophota bacterium]|nr:SPOR domain-containing protein [Candidatus Omnitrophota bacterium]HQL41020.1 SPOR domain-containing protein [Candidatus Omnitrophota bacterium]